jgi:protoporphyrin/coproporphyrin ferrochelatase
VGIVLMNHGCPHKAKGFVSGIAESQALYDKTREALMYRYPLISVGWLNHDTPLIDWTQPAADKAARNLIELGAKAIVFVPIGFATENHETLLDVHHIIHQLEVKHDQLKFVQMDCVNDHPEFLAMAARWATPQIEALLEEPKAHDHANHSHAAEHSHHHHGAVHHH